MKLRPLVFWAHLSLGLTIGTVVFIMAVTGMLMAYEPQLIDFAERKINHVSVPKGSARQNPSALMQAAQKSAGSAPSGITLKSEPEAAAIVILDRDKPEIFVNPYTAEVLGPVSTTRVFLKQVEGIHRWLGVKDKGKNVTHAVCFLFFGMILGGLFLWWPHRASPEAWQNATRFNSRLTGKAKDWNIHNVTGFWCSLLLLITVLTGLIMSYGWANVLFFRALGSAPPAPQAMRGAKPAAAPAPVLDFDTLMAQAQKTAPQWSLITVRAPREPGGPASAFIQEKGNPEFAWSLLSLDPVTSQVKKWEPWQSLPAARKARSGVKALHTGEIGGLAGQTAAFISALAALTLVWTGFAMSWRRFFSRTKK